MAQIKNDKPQMAPEATAEERRAILDKLAPLFSSSKVLSLDGEEQRGTFNKTKG
jgi:hypothetical protein